MGKGVNGSESSMDTTSPGSSSAVTVPPIPSSPSSLERPHREIVSPSRKTWMEIRMSRGRRWNRLEELAGGLGALPLIWNLTLHFSRQWVNSTLLTKSIADSPACADCPRTRAQAQCRNNYVPAQTTSHLEIKLRLWTEQLNLISSNVNPWPWFHHLKRQED